MYHHLPCVATFWAFLLTIDKDLAETARKKGCRCGGHLHCAHYPRKPRGTPEQLNRGRSASPIELLLRPRRLPEKSHTPIRAIPRPKAVYLGAVVVLVKLPCGGRVHIAAPGP